MIGKSLAHFEILEKIGAGGMGEVFRARDGKLQRDVALKFLPPEVVHDAARLQRFKREAQVLASLNHPNIAAIHGLETVGESTFLVLELIAGEDLSEVMARGPMPLEQALEIGRQIAEGMEAAHDQGVVHRDMKPQNIKLTPGGTVKILDFGLAKALEIEVAESSIASLPTRTSGQTIPGSVMGTPAYMSPEQARGAAVDRRADIWAFGCVLFEMVTGKRTFSGDTVSDVLASVLKTDPDWSAVPDEIPVSLRRLLRRLLDRDPRRRLRDIGEARVRLEAIAAGEADEEVAPASTFRGPRRRTVVLLVAAAGLVLGAAGFVAGGLLGAAPPDAPLRRFDISSFHQEAGRIEDPVISPDGRRVAYVRDDQVWVRDLDQIDPRKLEGTAGAESPFWSPDGREVGYFAGGNLWRIPATGGAKQQVCDLQGNVVGGRGADWGADGLIVFSRGGSGIYTVRAVGGEAHELIAVNDSTEGDLHEPHWLPDGGLLFVVHPLNESPHRLVVQYGDERTVLQESPSHRVVDPRYCASGHIVYTRRGQSLDGVWALPYSLADRAATDEPVLLVPECEEASVSPDGQLVYLNSRMTGEEKLVWVDAAGQIVEEITDTVQGVGSPALSPDGRRLALTMMEDEEIDIWIQDLRRGTRSRLPNEGAADAVANWASGGDSLYYWSSTNMIMVRALDSVTEMTPVVRGQNPSLSRDGRYLAFSWSGDQTGQDIFYKDLAGDAEPRPLVAGLADESSPKISPDGGLVAYISDESGADEAYIREFPGGGHPVRVSLEGALNLAWSEDGSRLMFVNRDAMFEVEVARSPQVELSRPSRMFELEPANLVPFRGFDYDDQGARFVMTAEIVRNDRSRVAEMVLVQNWPRILARD